MSSTEFKSILSDSKRNVLTLRTHVTAGGCATKEILQEQWTNAIESHRGEEVAIFILKDKSVDKDKMKTISAFMRKHVRRITYLKMHFNSTLISLDEFELLVVAGMELRGLELTNFRGDYKGEVPWGLTVLQPEFRLLNISGWFEEDDGTSDYSDDDFTLDMQCGLPCDAGEKAATLTEFTQWY